MKGWSYVYTGANQPFEAREYPVPEVDANGRKQKLLLLLIIIINM